MSVRVYRIEGKILLRSGEWQKFVVDVPALKPEHALERVFSSITGLHKVKRAHVQIKNLKVISPEETKNPLIQHIMEMKS